MMLRPVPRARLAGRLAAGVLAAAAATAGFAASTYIEQVTEADGMMGQPGRSATQKIWLTEQMICMTDAGGGMTTILRPEEGKLLLVDTGDESYSEMSLEQFNELAQMSMKMLEQMGQGGTPTVTVERTGATEEINGWKASEVKATVDGPLKMEMRVWLSEDVDVAMSAWERLAKLMNLEGMMGDVVDRLASYDGYPVRQTVTLNMMGRTMASTTEVTKVAEGPDDPPGCSVPAGFKKTEGMLPGMGGGPGGGR